MINLLIPDFIGGDIAQKIKQDVVKKINKDILGAKFVFVFNFEKQLFHKIVLKLIYSDDLICISALQWSYQKSKSNY